jgi:hypothetical protein
MKITVIVPTDFRVPRNREYYLGKDGVWMYQIMGYETREQTIGIAHEIEVPEGSEFIKLDWLKEWKGGTIATIPLPRPKKKVKKWQWALPCRVGNGCFNTCHMTENDMKRTYIPIWYHKIDETEIEVDE